MKGTLDTMTGTASRRALQGGGATPAATAAVMAVSAATTSVTGIPAGIVADERWRNMYRLKLGRGQLSEMLSLTRAKEALAQLRGRRP